MDELLEIFWDLLAGLFGESSVPGRWELRLLCLAAAVSLAIVASSVVSELFLEGSDTAVYLGFFPVLLAEFLLYRWYRLWRTAKQATAGAGDTEHLWP